MLAAEDAYVAAEDSRDEDARRWLVDDRIVHKMSHGKTGGKEDLIQAVLKMPMVSQALRERTMLIEGDVALIFGTAELHFARPGQEEDVSILRYTSTYVNRKGQWRMVALQMQARTGGE